MLLQYNNGIHPVDLFKINVMGFQTHRDNFCIDDSKNNLINRLLNFSQTEYNEEYLSKKFSIKSTSDFNIQTVQKELTKVNIEDGVIPCSYRPFEMKYIYYDRLVVDRPRKELLVNVKRKNNILLGIGRQGLAVGDIDWCLTTVSNHPVDANIFRRGGVNLFPLYLYHDENKNSYLETKSERLPNLNLEIVKQIAEKVSLTFTNEKETTKGTFAPIDILDYIYAVLHSPTYREKYKEFLKIDFPRVPFPKDQETFWKLVNLGGDIRQIHLLESPSVENYITQYRVGGDNLVVKPQFKDGKVFINETQYFDNVPQIAWEFYIGGYQPAQKWLKDRKDRKLEIEDIMHYQKIIVALTETHRLMQEIDKIDFE